MRSLANSMMRFKVLSFGAGCFNGVVCGIGDACMLIKPLKKACVFYSVFNCSFIHKRGGGVFSVSNPIKMQAHTDISGQSENSVAILLSGYSFVSLRHETMASITDSIS